MPIIIFVWSSKIFVLQNLLIFSSHFAVNKIRFAICKVWNENSYPGFTLQRATMTFLLKKVLNCRSHTTVD